MRGKLSQDKGFKRAEVSCLLLAKASLTRHRQGKPSFELTSSAVGASTRV